jgi:hypothetical protein
MHLRTGYRLTEGALVLGVRPNRTCKTFTCPGGWGLLGKRADPEPQVLVFSSAPRISRVLGGGSSNGSAPCTHQDQGPGEALEPLGPWQNFCPRKSSVPDRVQKGVTESQMKGFPIPAAWASAKKARSLGVSENLSFRFGFSFGCPRLQSNIRGSNQRSRWLTRAAKLQEPNNRAGSKGT